MQIEFLAAQTEEAGNTDRLNSNFFTCFILIDVAKAYDSMNRLKLHFILNNQSESAILTSFLDIYETLDYVVYGTHFAPKRGLPQESSLSPLMFNLYIDDTLREINKLNDVVAIAYADNVLIAGKSSRNLSDVYVKLEELLKSLDLSINEAKTEFISQSGKGLIISEACHFSCQPLVTYLGQQIGSNGKPIYNISSGHFVTISK